MSPVLREQLLLLPEYLQGHLALTFAALGAGIAMSVPLGIVASRSPRTVSYTHLTLPTIYSV